MEFSGAVEATKTLRAREKPIDARVDIAQRIIDGSASVMLPRRQLVVLEWIFDMLATDSAGATSAPLWNLLTKLWVGADENGRRRIYRNHRFVVNLAAALQTNDSPNLINSIAEALKSLSASLDIMAFATDSQASQLVLAYLKNDAAVVNQGIGGLIFQAVRARTNLFGGKVEPTTLNSLLREPDQKRRLHYLRDYCSEQANSVIAESDAHVEDVMQAVCESDIKVQSRFHELTSAFPKRSSRLLEVLITLRPREASPDLLEKLVSRSLDTANGSPDWTVMELCLHIDAAPVLKHAKKLLDAGPTDHVLSLMITRSAALRNLPEFLSQWHLQSSPSELVVSSLTRALESLPPMQIAPLLQPDSRILQLLVTSLTYKAAGSPQVKSALQNLLNADISLPVKLAVLEIAPSLEVPSSFKKAKSFMIDLRVSEIHNSAPDLKAIIKRVDSESSAGDVVLRFYPLLEHAVDSAKQLRKLMDKCSRTTRLELAQTYGIYEHPKFTEALIEKLIDAGEFDALIYVPLQVLAWNQRHRIVDAALKRGDSSTGELISRLIDSANPPEPRDLSRVLRSFEAVDVKTFISIVKPVLRHQEYANKLLGQPGLEMWQSNLIVAMTDATNAGILKWVKKEYDNSGLRMPILEILNLLPPSPEVSQIVERLAVQLSSNPPELLFELVCRRKYHWSIITALFAYSKYQFTAAYLAYCKELSPEERDCLVMAAVDENEHGVLRCLAAGRMLQGQKHANALTAAIARCCFGAVEITADFVNLCDTVLREQLDLISGFALEMIVAIASKLGRSGRLWEEFDVLLSHVLLFQRRQLRGRMHLVVAALTSLLEGVDAVERAVAYVRLVENLCSPPQHYLGGATTKEELNSAVARDRRNIAKNLGVLLQNYVSIVLLSQRGLHDTTEVNTALRPAAFAMMDVLGGEGVRAVAAGLDSASRTYLRSIYEDYTQNARWTSD